MSHLTDNPRCHMKPIPCDGTVLTTDKEKDNPRREVVPVPRCNGEPSTGGRGTDKQTAQQWRGHAIVCSRCGRTRIQGADNERRLVLCGMRSALRLDFKEKGFVSLCFFCVVKRGIA